MKELKLTIVFSPATDFQSELGEKSLQGMGKAFTEFFNSRHKKNKASWFIDIKHGQRTQKHTS